MHIFIHIFAQELKQVSFTGSFDTNNLLLVMPNQNGDRKSGQASPSRRTEKALQ